MICRPVCKKCSSCWKPSTEAALAPASTKVKPNLWNAGGIEPTGTAGLSAAARRTARNDPAGPRCAGSMVVAVVLPIHQSQLLLERHDEQVFKCLSKVFQTETLHPHNHKAAIMPLTLGGLGLGSAQRTRDAAHWECWAHSSKMIRARHPEVARKVVKGCHPIFHVSGISGKFSRTFEDRGCQDPKLGGTCRRCETSDEAIEGSRTERTPPRLAESGSKKSQHPAQRRSGVATFDTVGAGIRPIPKVVRWLPSLSQRSQLTESCELIRSRSGCCCCAAAACHCSSPTVSARVAVLSHHRTACGKMGVLSKRGYAVRVLSPRSVVEDGDRVSANVIVRDLDIAQGNTDSRRLDVIAEGLSLFGGVQLALAATLVSAHQGDGTPLRKADTCNGSDARSQAEGRHVPRTVWDGRKSQDGGHCK